MPRRSPEKLDSIDEVPEEDAMAAKRGRPPKPVDARRTAQLNVAFTADEKARVVTAAEARAISVADLVLAGLDALEILSAEKKP